MVRTTSSSAIRVRPHPSRRLPRPGASGSRSTRGSYRRSARCLGRRTASPRSRPHGRRRRRPDGATGPEPGRAGTRAAPDVPGRARPSRPLFTTPPKRRPRPLRRSGGGTRLRRGGSDWSASLSWASRSPVWGWRTISAQGCRFAAFFGAALLVTGITLLAAARLGRARGLLPLGILLLVGLLATSVVQTAIQRDEWSRTLHSYAQVAELPPNGDSRDMGRLTTDLSTLSLTGDASYRAPSKQPWQSYRGRAPRREGPGQLRDRFGHGPGLRHRSRGWYRGCHDTVEPDGTGTATPVLTLDLSVDSGKIVVRR